MPLISFAKTLRQFHDGSKDLTRRDGWLKLRAGDILTPVEWSPRVGARWFCATCQTPGPVGMPPAKANARRRYERRLTDWQDLHRHGEPLGADNWQFRRPRRFEDILVVSARRERLGDITRAEVAREGFPNMSPDEFVVFYCAPGRTDPDRRVTRIEFERMEP